jgi:thiosulfate/3-mercaptopyruvate sulfurtransferase
MNPFFSTIISPGELASRLDEPDWHIFDTRFSLADPDRGRRAYLEGHVPGALYAHLDDDLSGRVIPGKTGRHPLPDVDEFSKRLGRWGITDGHQVVVYDDSGGGIAARLWWMLHWLGHSTAAVLDGGWQAWQAGEFPVSRMVPMLSPQVFRPRPQEEMLVSTSEVEQGINGALVDSRTSERFLGLQEPIDPIAGHIPGAVNAFHGLTIGADGSFLSPEALRRHFQAIPGLDQGAVFYCGSGVTACRNILGMEHAGLQGAQLYAGSWSEWITDPNHPIVREDPES